MSNHSRVLFDQPIDYFNGINFIEIVSEDRSDDDLIVSKITLENGSIQRNFAENGESSQEKHSGDRHHKAQQEMVLADPQMKIATLQFVLSAL